MPMHPADRFREPTLYRPFALLAFAGTLAGGTPLGIWMLAWLYWGAPAAPIQWLLLHAHLQTFGFFATLIPGVAQHLFARFTGRPVTPHPGAPWVVGLLVAALALRLAGTASASPTSVLAASLLQAAAFLLVAAWVWRWLDPPPLALLRRQLAMSTGWFAAACLLEAALRWRALTLGLPVPAIGGMRAVHAMALFGGVLGWVLGVLLRAGPMFVPGWSAPLGAARLVPWLLALAVCITVVGEMGGWEPTVGAALARLGEFIALAAVAAVMALGGALRRTRGVLPMVARSGEESRIFRLAVISAAAAMIGSALAAVVSWSGRDAHLLTDAVRHLVTVGFLTSVVVAMAFRLIPVLERRALPWPRLRAVALWALAAAVLLRTAEVLVPLGLWFVAPWVPLSGFLVWIALASVSANLAGTLWPPRRER